MVMTFEAVGIEIKKIYLGNIKEVESIEIDVIL